KDPSFVFCKVYRIVLGRDPVYVISQIIGLESNRNGGILPIIKNPCSQQIKIRPARLALVDIKILKNGKLEFPISIIIGSRKIQIGVHGFIDEKGVGIPVER